MAIVEATLPYAVAYKINSAFYEVQGAAGWDSLIQTIAFIQSKQKFVILDAKRGDIGNTASLYARTCFETLNADAVTVAPYMGKDSVTPFLDYARRWTILLALTSNSGTEFSTTTASFRRICIEKVLKKRQWGHQDQLMFVAGAQRSLFTKDESLFLII
jgi:orotidine-5'-phosphate decarboxylase